MRLLLPERSELLNASPSLPINVEAFESLQVPGASTIVRRYVLLPAALRRAAQYAFMRMPTARFCAAVIGLRLRRRPAFSAS